MDSAFIKISDLVKKLTRNYVLRFHGESPIEEKLIGWLLRFNVNVEPQKKIGPYRADIFIESKYQKIVVECDGEDFHKNKGKDQKRDQYMKDRGLLVLRFTGSQINRSAEACAVKVIENIAEIYSTEKFQKYLNERLLKSSIEYQETSNEKEEEF